MVLCRPSPCGRRLVDAVMARCIPRPPGFAHSAVLGWATNLPRHTHQLGPSAQPRRDGVGAATRPPDGVGRWGPLWHWGLPAKSAVRGPSAEAEKSALRRRRAPADDSSRRRRRALPAPATAAAALWFQSQRQGLNGTAVAHARRHKHCSTAAATTAHVGHRSLHCTARATASAALRAEPMPPPAPA